MSEARMPSNIREAIASPEWWGPWYPRPAEWKAWGALLAASFALPMDDEELAIYRECTGRAEAPTSQAKEIYGIVGRRGGKTRTMATVAAFLAIFVDWRSFLAPGERASVLMLAADRKQARLALRYARALIVEHPTLSQLVENDQNETLELRNRVTIEVATSSFRSSRGYTLAAAICDEAAYWLSEETSANPASEILAALRPAMKTLRGSLLMVISSPYAKRGPMWDARRKHYGKDADPILVWQAPTWVMNPTISRESLDEEFENDPASAAAEYGAEFRTDIAAFIDRAVVDAAIPPGRHELPPLPGITYLGFTDPSGGTSDSMTLAIVHLDKERRVILDAVRETRAPFAPDGVTEEFAEVLKSYRLHKVTGDRYAGEWPRERFRAYGITYELSEKPKSDLYRDLLPVLNSGRAELLDLPRLASQLCGLERRTARGGRDSIDHAPGAKDDIANAVAGAVVHATSKPGPMVITQEMLEAFRRPGPYTHRHSRSYGRNFQ